ncbi:hypothetical protein [Demequina sp.]|uniref:hypothetical protein n=1 Tax=Demequina sp. TaxID=2050685 RepID=UPI003A848860
MALNDLIAMLEARPTSFSREYLTGRASRGGIASAIRRGAIARVLPDRYAAGLHARSWLVRSHAAAMWGPERSALTGAGVLCEAGVITEEPPGVHLFVPRWRHRPSPPWLTITSSLYVPAVYLRHDDAPMVDPELAFIHAYGFASEDRRAELLYALTRSGALNLERVRDHLARLPRVRGRASMMRRLGHAADGIESYLEERGAEDVLTGAPFAGLVRQHRITVTGESFRLDAYDPATRTAFEFDSKAHHQGVDKRRRDLRRDALLSSVGIETVRFDYVDVMSRPQWCRDIAIATLVSRGAQTSVAS